MLSYCSFCLFVCFFLDYYLYMSMFTSPEATNCFDISTLMIIREHKIIDQFPTPKHQQILLPFWKLLAFNVIITVRWLKRDDAKLLANHRALFSLIINVIIPGFLKTGLAKILTHSTTWQFKTTKLIQRPIKSLYLTPGSKLMVPRSIPTSPNLKWRKF